MVQNKLELLKSSLYTPDDIIPEMEQLKELQGFLLHYKVSDNKVTHVFMS